jgi:predicted glycosyltransferase
VIGYYAHHLGQGHAETARCIARRLTDEVTVLSSLPRPPGWPAGWVALPRDDDEAGALEPNANGQLHWAPLGHRGLRDRMAGIARWIQDFAPTVFVIDVSVEVAALARLTGTPVVTIVLPGKRRDPAHRLCYTLADAMLAPWPASVSSILLDGDSSWHDKIRHVGAFSRFDDRASQAVTGSRRHSVLVLLGSGGSAVTGQDLRQAAAATPNWRWTAVGGPTGRWAEDPWTALCRADVVVTHAGLNSLAAVAAARKPAIVVPQARPHDEQIMTARALARTGLAIVAHPWPQPARWPGLLRAAAELGGGQWTDWSPGTGAQAAAEVIQSVAARTTGTGIRCAAPS